jgi:hypothetical protein
MPKKIIIILLIIFFGYVFMQLEFIYFRYAHAGGNLGMPAGLIFGHLILFYFIFDFKWYINIILDINCRIGIDLQVLLKV